MKKHTLLVLILGILILCSCARAEGGTIKYDSGWYTYRNDKYRYEIHYPEGFDLWATGAEGERDGATIRIALNEYAAPTPVLDIQIHPMASWEDVSTGIEVNEMAIIVDDVEIDGVAGKQIVYRWETSGELFLVELYFDDVLFRFQAGPGLYDFHDTLWWEIISTFRFLEV